MTYNGAKGKTQAAMAKTLNVRALITEMTLMSQKNVQRTCQ
jgi:serine protease inhibitor